MCAVLGFLYASLSYQSRQEQIVPYLHSWHNILLWFVQFMENFSWIDMQICFDRRIYKYFRHLAHFEMVILIQVCKKCYSETCKTDLRGTMLLFKSTRENRRTTVYIKPGLVLRSRVAANYVWLVLTLKKYYFFYIRSTISWSWAWSILLANLR